MDNNQDINNTYNCQECNYHTDIKMNWTVHLLTEKHKRNGLKKPISCDKCNYIGLNHWNLKLHKHSQHSTIEERKKSKYYCEYCDQIFICKIYMDRHNEGSKHKKNIPNIPNIANV
jgi:hypothetical protein